MKTKLFAEHVTFHSRQILRICDVSRHVRMQEPRLCVVRHKGTPDALVEQKAECPDVELMQDMAIVSAFL